MTQFQYLQKKLFSKESTKELQQIFEDILSLDATKIHLHPYFSYGILRRSFDSGMMLNRQLLCNRMKVHTTPGVLVLKRSSLIHLLIQQLFNNHGEYNDTEVTFFLIDIKNLRSADFPDQLGNKAADFILNNVASRLDQMCRESLPSIVPIKALLGRYGGDEFLITVIGAINNTTIEKINQLIASEIQKEHGFYKQNNGRILFKPVEIKNNTCEIIRIPKHKEKQLIFFHYLRQQLLLNTKDLENIYQISGSQNIQTIQNECDSNRDSCIYQSSQLNIDEKINYFEKAKPDLRTIIELAKQLDYVISNNKKIYQMRLLSFIENVVYDRLLNEEVRGFGDIGIEIQNGAFDQIYAFDIKFIKELNDQFSVLQGDMVILGFFQHISRLFTRSEKQEGIYFARRGGTILVGIKKNFTLSCESQSRIKRFLASKMIYITNSYFNLTIPVGVASLVFDEHTSGQKYETIVDMLITEAIMSWHRMIVPLFLDSAVHIDDFKKQVSLRMNQKKPLEIEFVSTNTLKIIELIYLYFLGSHSCFEYENNVLPIRYIDRINGLIEYISNVRTQVILESGLKELLVSFVDSQVKNDEV
jgi:diguanylate cyclase (GGDEF)-like protein